MIKRITLILTILLAAIILSGCREQMSIELDYDYTSTALNAAGEYKGEVYYIGITDSFLYKGIEDSKVFLEEQILLFAFNDDMMVCLSDDSQLILVDMLSMEKKHIDINYTEPMRGRSGFGYIAEIDAVLYSDRLIYLDENGYLSSLDLNDGKTETLYEEEVLLCEPYYNYILFTTRQKNVFKDNNDINILSLSDGSAAHFLNMHISGWRLHEDKIYYAHNYYVYSLDIDMENKNIKRLIQDSRIFSLKVNPKGIMCMSSQGLIYTDLMGDGLKVISPDDCHAIYSDSEYSVFYNLVSQQTYLLNHDTMNAELLDDNYPINLVKTDNNYLIRYSGEEYNQTSAEYYCIYDLDFNLVKVIE